jgi:hypothetical protein
MGSGKSLLGKNYCKKCVLSGGGRELSWINGNAVCNLITASAASLNKIPVRCILFHFTELYDGGNSHFGGKRTQMRWIKRILAECMTASGPFLYQLTPRKRKSD